MEFVQLNKGIIKLLRENLFYTQQKVFHQIQMIYDECD